MDEKIFSCRRCGQCCFGETTVSLSEADQLRMLAVLGIAREEAEQRFWRCNGTQVQMKTQDGHCIFYDNGCSVHSGRPWRCRQWPFVDAILKDPVNLTIIRASCPGFSSSASYDEICAFILAGGLLEHGEMEKEGYGI